MLRQIACQRPTYGKLFNSSKDVQFGESLQYEIEYALSRMIETEVIILKS